MRRVLIAACLLVLCAAAADAAQPIGPVPAPSWPVDRFGRTMVPYIDTAQISLSSSIGVTAQGHAMTGGWSDFLVMFATYNGVPLSGIYEARLVGVAPRGMVTQQITHFSSIPTGFATRAPQSLRGFHICAQSGCITVLTDGTVIGGNGVVMGKGGKTQ